MAISALDHEMNEQWENLSHEQRRQVLEYVRALRVQPQKGVPGRTLLRHAGTISKEDAREILQAVEEGCEQIDPHGW